MHRGQRPRFSRGRQGRGGLNLPQTPESMWRRLYIRGRDDSVEKLVGYRPGGYHPVHLHDHLHDGQYRVIHKLGHGGFSTVWLCRDMNSDPPKYVAVKILMARQNLEHRELSLAGLLRAKGVDKELGADHICLPLDKFEIEGPNGTHTCLVYPVLGPPASYASDIFSEEETIDQTLRRLAQQTVEAVSGLHKHGICHGDLRPSNILLRLQDLDGVTEDQVLGLLGEPETAEIMLMRDSRPTPTVTCAPRYVVYPVDFYDIDASLIPKHAYLIDFGEAFDTSQTPLPTRLGIPVEYGAPEIIFGEPCNTSVDLWSLGCTLFEIRLGVRLFTIFQLMGFHKDEYLIELALLLGKPPDTWWMSWAERDEVFETVGAADCQSIGVRPGALPNRGSTPRPIKERIVTSHDCMGQNCSHEPDQVLSEDEVELMTDLLGNLLRYRPEERLAATSVLHHDWFKM